jgi:hypothetical protein
LKPDFSGIISGDVMCRLPPLKPARPLFLFAEAPS